jgi:prevent-host-death family protein
VLITTTELKTNIGHYLDEVSRGEVYISRNGKVVAKLSSPSQDKQAILDSLAGIAADNPISLEEARAERLARQ